MSNSTFNTSSVLSSLCFAALTTLSSGAMAQHMDHSAHGSMPAATAEAGTDAKAAQQAVLTNGEVVRTNPATGKLTIRHEEIKNLNMPPMSMVFALKNPADAATFKAGDKVRFHAEDVNGALVITQIEAAAQ